MKIQILSFDELSKHQLYELLRLRTAVFVVEQNCPYQELDNLDQQALHVLGYKNEELVACARILPPNVQGKLPAIGRVLTAKSVRRKNWGKEIFAAALKKTNSLFPEQNISVLAQTYLINFYQNFGFAVASDEFLEDGIPHVEMVYKQS